MKTFSITFTVETGADLIAAAVCAAQGIQHPDLELDSMPVDESYFLGGSELIQLQRHD